MTPSNKNAYPETPRIGVGAIVIHEGKILLVRRGIDPGRGLWAIPGGTLQLGETMRQCAAREVLEETGVSIAVGDCLYVFDLIQRDENNRIEFHFVVVDFAGVYVSGQSQGADDADEARWFAAEELSGFPVSQNTLKALHSIGFLT